MGILDKLFGRGDDQANDPAPAPFDAANVRPLYRGEPPKDFARLADLNDRVVEGIEAVYQAAS